MAARDGDDSGRFDAAKNDDIQIDGIETDNIEPAFIENDAPRDGELSVTSLGKVAGPLRSPKHERPKPHTGRESLGTPNLGVHVME